MSAAITGRCYTRARRLPLMVGRLPGASGPLWGGPYTVTQLAVFAAGLLVMWGSHPVWAHLGVGWNAAVFLGVPALAAWAIRHARVDGRTPLFAAMGVFRAVWAPSSGRLAGRRYRPVGRRLIRRARFFVWEQPPEAGSGER